jgi:hypothetical protein
MKNHEDRVIAEKAELEERMNKLVNFMMTDTYASLPAVDQGLLMVQVRSMKMYSECLSDRIERFN